MVAAFFPQRYTQQPPQPVQIDRNLPLSAGLVGAFYANMGAAKANGGASLLASRDGPGFTTSSTADYWLASSTALASASATWTIMVIVNGNTTNTGSGANLYCERPNDTQIVKLGITGGTNSNAAQLVVRDMSGNLIILTGNANVKTESGRRRVVTATRRAANDHRLYVGDQLDNTATANINGAFGASNATIGNDPFDTGSTLNGASVGLVLVWARSLSDSEIAQASRNPYQVLRTAGRNLYLVSSKTISDNTLSGSATSVVSASGSLSANIVLSGSASSFVAASGSITSYIRFSGAASAASSASGILSTAINLSGSSVGQVSSYGSLLTSIALSGIAQARANATGDLVAPGTGLSGYARVVATAAGDLSTSIRLSGGASVASNATGNLYTATTLSGSAIVRVTASGMLADNSAGKIEIDASKLSGARTVLFPGAKRAVAFGGAIRTVRFPNGA